MSDLICRKTMTRCRTPSMCAPYGGCNAPCVESVFKSDYDALAARVAHLEQQPQWISVEERLPECGERVLCYVDLGDLQYQEVSTFHGDSFGDVVALKVTHWLPLPSPPTP